MQKIVRTTAFDYVVFRIGKENCDALKKRGVLKEVYGKITDDTIPCIRFFNSGNQIRYYDAYEEKFESFADEEYEYITQNSCKKENYDINILYLDYSQH